MGIWDSRMLSSGSVMKVDSKPQGLNSHVLCSPLYSWSVYRRKGVSSFHNTCIPQTGQIQLRQEIFDISCFDLVMLMY